MSAALANLSVALAVMLTGLATILAITGFIAWGRLRHGRLLWVALAFVGFVVQGIVLTADAWSMRADPTFPATALLSFLIVVALYFAVLHR